MNLSSKSKNNHLERLKKKALSLPDKSGCYLMKHNSYVIYVGKAKNLKSRVSNYFSKSYSISDKNKVLVNQITSFDFLLTKTEAEAFILENNLIKKYKPKYNVVFRDDKTYPYIAIDYNEPFPRLKYIRRPKAKKNVKIFGPFAHGSNVSKVLNIITKSFMLRDCSLYEFNNRKEPCLLYQLKQCSAPCIKKIKEDDYNKNLDLALSFFIGKGCNSIQILNEYMIASANNEEFERAALLRDYIKTLKEFTDTAYQKNVEFLNREKDIDVASYYQLKDEVDVSIYIIRNGILFGHKNFDFNINQYMQKHNTVKNNIYNIIFQYYSKTSDTLPRHLIMPFEDKVFCKVLKDNFNINFKKATKKYANLIELVKDNAYETQRVRLSKKQIFIDGLKKLKALLRLKYIPKVLECYDIAIFQGTSPTASQIVFRNGEAVKDKYRHYKLKELKEGNNDFAMLREVLKRRIKYEDFPDVFVVDGGRAQVNTFLKALEEFNLDIPVVGIAKASKTKSSNYRLLEKNKERLIIANRINPYILSNNKGLFKIMVSIRDEAHRFSRRLHHKHESKRVITSWIDSIKGIKKSERENIYLKIEKSIDELLELSVDEIKNYFNISLNGAKKVREHLLLQDK